jgi:tetratricopeptide (TPR) repeat protein
MTMRRSSLTASGTLLAMVTFGMFVSAGACGGATTKAKTATGLGSDAAAPVTTPVSNAQGQTVGISAGPAADTELTGDAKDAYARGFSAWAAGDLAGAKAAFTDAASKAPSAGGPRYSLGCVLVRLGDTQGALDAYRSSYTANPKYEIGMGAYALLQAQLGHGSDAEQFLGSKGATDSVRLMTYLAEVKSIEGDSPGCQLLAQQALAKQPDSKDAMVVIARDFYRNHKWDLAKYALQAILEGSDDGSLPPRDKGNPDALLMRGLIERDTGDRKSALNDFDQASQKRPDLFEAYVNLGEMKLEAGNAGDAQAPLEKAVKYAPNSAIAHLDLGDCYRLLGRPGDAKSELEKARGMDSTLAGVHYDLGLLYLYSPSVPGASGQADQLSKAITELQQFQSMRNAKVKGPGDDVDDLISTAKRKQSELQMKAQAAAAAASASAAAAAAPPASSGGGGGGADGGSP